MRTRYCAYQAYTGGGEIGIGRYGERLRTPIRVAMACRLKYQFGGEVVVQTHNTIRRPLEVQFRENRDEQTRERIAEFA